MNTAKDLHAYKHTHTHNIQIKVHTNSKKRLKEPNVSNEGVQGLATADSSSVVLEIRGIQHDGFRLCLSAG